MRGEKSHIFKARTLSGTHGRIYGRHTREGGCAIPGEVCRSAQYVLLPSRGGGMGRQESAEGIVGFSTEPKA
jgi:hypothetical protein